MCFYCGPTLTKRANAAVLVGALFLLLSSGVSERAAAGVQAVRLLPEHQQQQLGHTCWQASRRHPGQADYQRRLAEGSSWAAKAS